MRSAPAFSGYTFFAFQTGRRHHLLGGNKNLSRSLNHIHAPFGVIFLFVYWCRPCHVLSHFPWNLLLHFPTLLSTLAFSTPAFSVPPFCSNSTASRRTPIHQVSLLSHARIDVYDNDDNDNDNAWQRGPLWPHSLSLIHIWRCRRSYACRSRWSPYH